MAGGGLSLQSDANVTGTGVTFYNTSSAGWGCSRSYPYFPVTIGGWVTANLSAPTTGAYDGILFFGNRTGCSMRGWCADQIGGGPKTVLNGALYFAGDKVAIAGSDVSGLTMLVADQIRIYGNSDIGCRGHNNTVSVSPTTATLAPLQTQQFTASMRNSSHAAIGWSIAPGMGSISSAGMYTAPSTMGAMQTVTVTATNQADAGDSGTATIILLPSSGTTTPTITWPAPAPITYGIALSATQLDATASVPGAFAYTPASGTVLAAGSQTLSVTFTPTNTASYSTVTASVPLTVNDAAPAITWTAPAAITYGTALSATQLDATASVPGTFAYTPASGTVLTAGSQTLSVTFTPTNTADYSTATASVSLTVNKAAPAITWAAPAAITHGTALSTAQLDATASVPGTFAYTPASGTVLAAGSQTLSVTFTPTNGASYLTATASVPLTVNKAAPAITWAAPAAITYGTALSTTQLDATASVPGTFAYSPASGTVLAAGSQTLSVTFTPTDSTDYNTATASVPLTVNEAASAITWAAPAAITYGTALSATQLDATASVPGTFAYSPASGTVLAAGSQTLSVTFTPTNTASYSTATASVPLTVNKATPAITWAAPAAITYGTAIGATQLDATASVAGTFAYTPASGTVLAAGSQTLSVTFTPTDSTDYNTATANVSLTVNKATPAITWAAPAAITYGAALSATQLDATASVPGTFAYTPASGTMLAAGSQTLSVTFTPTDSTDYNTATASVSLTVNKATPAITWAAPAAITYGAALSATQLDATASVAGTFAYTPASGTMLAAGSQTLSVTFTPTNTTDYNTATASVSLTVNKAAPAITWAAPAAITYGTAIGATQLDATASVAGTFAYTPASGTVLAAGSQTLSVTFTPTNTTDYNTATASVSLTVNKATPIITWATPAAITYPTALGAAQLDATASVAGTFAYSPGAGTVLSAGLQTLSVTFTPTNTTDYTAATATVSLIVNQALPVITWPAPAAITYGTALGAAQLDAAANVPGAFVYSPASGAVLQAGSQTLSVIFSPTDSTDYHIATASVSLTVNSPPISVSVAPSSMTLYDGQTLQFTAVVTNGNGTGVTWSISPTGSGSINSTGLYTAPTTISAQQTVTVTGTSVANSTISASTTVTLSPAQCGTNGYSYQRAIVINSTKVPNTDQVNFPFLFNSTDPMLASTANGGHVTSANGYDILFTSDPAGQNILSYEMESYDPVHGQVTAWVRIPTLSHTSDTVIYMFYGNSGITTSQQNAAGVWDSNYEAVYHLSDAGSSLATDSTANANSAPYTSVVSAPGEIAGAAAFNGNSSYMQIPGAAFPSYPYTGEGGSGQYTTTDGFAASFEAWFKTTTEGVILGQVANGTYPGGGRTPSIPGLYIDSTGILRACFFDTNGAVQIVSSAAYNDGNWHHAAVTFTDGTETLYVDGQALGSQQTDETSYAYTYWYFVGAGFAQGWANTNDYWFYFGGDVDEVSVSNSARSADWIATEFNNQDSPSTFYTLYAENGELVVPAVVSLSAGQSQQFTVAPRGACVSEVTWSMNAGAPGTLTSSGLYTAPASIAAQSTVTVIATSIADPTTTGSAFVTLLPPASSPAVKSAATVRSRRIAGTSH